MSVIDLRDAESESSTVNGEIIRKHKNEGAKVPIEITIALLRSAMINAGWHEKIFLIEGFPKTKESYFAWKAICTDVDVMGLIHFICPGEI